MKKQIMALGLTLAVTSACAAIPPQPANPKVVNDIMIACTVDGMFQSNGGRLVLNTAAAGFPGAPIITGLIQAGVDKVCANPTLYASDITTAAWVVRNIRDTINKARRSSHRFWRYA